MFQSLETWSPGSEYWAWNFDAEKSLQVPSEPSELTTKSSVEASRTFQIFYVDTCTLQHYIIHVRHQEKNDATATTKKNAPGCMEIDRRDKRKLKNGSCDGRDETSEMMRFKYV